MTAWLTAAELRETDRLARQALANAYLVYDQINALNLLLDEARADGWESEIVPADIGWHIVLIEKGTK